MQLKPIWARSTLVATASMIVVICTFAAPAVNPIVVAVRCNADDGLSLRLKDAIEDAFKSSTDFSLSDEKGPNAFVVTIPTNIRWKQVGGRIRVLYAVELASSHNQAIRTVRGSCWDGSLAKCADQVVKKARGAAHKLQ